MKQNAPFFDQIDAFLAGQLSDEAANALRQAMLDDPELAREVDIRRLEFEVSEAQIAAAIRAQMQQLKAGAAANTGLHPWWRQWRLGFLAVAGFFLLIIGYCWFTKTPYPISPTQEQPGPQEPPPAQQPTPQEQPPQQPPLQQTPARPVMHYALAAELYQNPDLGSLRSANTSPGDAYARVVEAWEKQDFQSVLLEADKIPPNAPVWIRAAFLKAHAAFKLNRYAESTDIFLKIADSKSMPWAEEAEWYGLLAMLADGQEYTPMFQSRLKKMSADDNHPYMDSAQILALRLKQK